MKNEIRLKAFGQGILFGVIATFSIGLFCVVSMYGVMIKEHREEIKELKRPQTTKLIEELKQLIKSLEE